MSPLNKIEEMQGCPTALGNESVVIDFLWEHGPVNLSVTSYGSKGFKDHLAEAIRYIDEEGLDVGDISFASVRVGNASPSSIIHPIRDGMAVRVFPGMTKCGYTTFFVLSDYTEMPRFAAAKEMASDAISFLQSNNVSIDSDIRRQIDNLTYALAATKRLHS